MAEIIFERSDGNLGRLPASEDSFSGLLVVAHEDVLSFSPHQYEFTSAKQALETLDNDGSFFEGNGDIDNFIFYHIQEFFRMQPNARLLVRFSVPTTAGNPFVEEVLTMQNAAEGKIRQLAVMVIPNLLNDEGEFGNAISYADPFTQISNLNAASVQSRVENMPLHILYAPKTSHLATLSSLPNLRGDTFGFENVSVIIGGSTIEENALLEYQTGFTGTHTSIGAALGTISKTQVYQNIGWVEKFNIGLSKTAIFINNSSVKISSLGETDLKTLTEKGYIFPRKYVGLSGTYWNDSPTCAPLTSDFAYIENNRTLDKAIRQTRILLLPSLNAPVYLNVDGTLTAKDVSRLSVTSRKALEQMQRDGEVSNFSIFIDPNQNVLSTSEIQIEMEIQPVGVARKLNVKIGFAANVA